MNPLRFIIVVVSLAASPAAADEACRRDPDPVCMADWAVTLASKGTVEEFRRHAVTVRLRLGRVAEAHRMLGDPAANSPDPNAAEIAARIGNRELGQRTFHAAREQVEKLADTLGGRLTADRYRDLADSERRAGEVERARATARRWVERLRADIHRGDARGTARYLALAGFVMLRAGDHEGSTAAAADAEKVAPLDESALEGDDERMVELFRSLRSYDVIARLRRSLGQGDALGQKLAALVPKVAAAASSGTSRRIAVAGLVLGHLAAAEAYLGNRDAALRALALAQDLRARVTGEFARLIEMALIPAYVALGAWDAANKSAQAVPEDDTASLWRLMAVEQARQGALKECIATVLKIPRDRHAGALAEAARAAPDER